MHLLSFGHIKHKHLTFKINDLYFDIRDDLISCSSKKSGVVRTVQKNYLKQQKVKKFYRKKILKKVLKTLKKRKHTRWKIFIGDHDGLIESVVFIEQLERDLIKKCNIHSTVEHLTINEQFKIL